MKKYVILLFFLIFPYVTFAQSRNLIMLDSLISRGNRAYANGQRNLILECADSIQGLIDLWNLKDDEYLDYRVSLMKLLGNYFYEEGDFIDAEYYYNSAHYLMQGSPDTDFHTNDILLPREKAQLYYRVGNYSYAAEIMEDLCEDLEYNQRYRVGGDDWIISWMTYAMCLARLKKFDQALQIADREIANALDKKGLPYAKALRMQAKIKLLADADKKGALKAYKSFFDTQKKYAMANFANMDVSQRQEYWHDIQPFVTDCYLLEDIDPGFVYDVSLFSKGLLLQLSRISGDGKASKEALKTLEYGWKDIQKKLNKNQAAAEFIQYEKDGKTRMAAVLLKKSGKPEFIPLDNAEDILNRSNKALNTNNKLCIDSVYNDDTLHKLVWTDRFMNSLHDVDRLYFAPDGRLHVIAIEYFPQVENMELYRLTSTRRLMEPSTRTLKNKPMLLVGAIDFNKDAQPNHNNRNDAIAYYYCRSIRFPDLDTLNDEARRVYESRANDNDRFITGSVASENAFCQLAPSFESIIISSHGDFTGEVPTSTDIKPVADDDSMSQNIIAFSGINNYLDDYSFDASSAYDGILSAKEIASMDLSKCSLFVVSACKTGLGEISSDGVFGLQRGLKNAGVNSMILSLWSVSSFSTSLLFQYFYAFLEEGFPVRNAFMMAREKLKNAREANRLIEDFDFNTWEEVVKEVEVDINYENPQYINPFILIDVLE